ncbi:integrase catalytic domain-containing protein [Trichonephila clavipes]|nr:integrase catalytic domain-containing protein [Trichonephila clavipes]
MKCLLQDLWKEEIQWDDPLPTHIEQEWKKWCEELPHLRNLKIPRLVLDSTLLEDDVELHSFCDANKKAYGAAIYLRTKSRNGISVKLVTSKSRVAPLNCVTLSRLELLGALVTARLASKEKKIVKLKISCLQYHWTDSKIVLFWVKGNKTRWKQFVANRVNEINSLTDPTHGTIALQVVPELDYLTEHEQETVVQERKKLPEADKNEETVLLNSDSSSIHDELLELSNNYFKVINILFYIFRFNYNCRSKSKKVGPLTVAEFKESEIKLIKHAQRSLFDKKEIPSCISNLFPFVDGEVIVHVGGRLENSSVSYLPASFQVTHCIARHGKPTSEGEFVKEKVLLECNPTLFADFKEDDLITKATGTTVSRQTVYRRLGYIGLYARKSVRCIPLTPTHCRLRLTWSREHAFWTPQQWSFVMFSIESTFNLLSDSRRNLTWRAQGTRYHQENTIERYRYGGAGWLVWGGIIFGSRTDLHVESITMTGHIYRDVILEHHDRLFRGPWVLNFG